MPKPPPLVEVGPPRPRNAILIHDDDDRSGGLGRDSRPVVGTGGQGGRRADEGDRFGGSERGRGGSSGGGHAARQSPLAPSSPAVVRAPRPHEVIELDDYDSGSERPEKVAPRVERRRLFKEEPIEYSGSDPEDARARARARVAASALGGSRKSSKRRRESKPHKAGGRGEPGGSGKQSIRRGPGRPRLHYSNDESSGAPRKKLKSAGRRRHHDHKGGGDRGRHDDAAPARQVGAVVASGARSRHDDRRKVASAAKYPASVGSDGSEDDDYPPYSNHRSSGSPAKVKSAGCRRQDHKAGDRGRHDGAPARQVGAVVASRSSGSPAKVKSAGCGRHSHKGGGSSDWRGSAPARQVGAAVSSRTRSRNGDDRRKVASEAKYVEEVISSDDNGGSRGNQEDDVVKGTNKVDDNGDNSEDMYKSVEEEDGNGVHDDSYAGVDEEENDDTTEPQEEEEEEEEREEEEEEEESHEAGEEPRRTPSSNAKAGGSARPGGDGTPPIRKMKFEGLCLVDNADTTSAGEGVRNRTRSQRRCSDKKLLARGIFSKPYCIDVSESDPEEEVPPPAQTENVQPSNTAFGDDSDDDEDRAPAKKRRRRQQVFHRDDSGSESDRTLARNAKKGPSSGRAKNGGAPYRQQQHTAKEGCCQDYAGCSNPQRVKNHYAGNPADRGDPQMQGDVAFKKNSLLPHKGGKRWKNTQEKKAYDDLFNSMFDELEKHPPNGSAPAAQAQQDTQPQPLLFSFGDEDEVEEEKSEYDKKMDELWGDLDLILEGRNDSQSPEEEQDEEGNGEKNPVNKATLCEPGKEHDFIENDQIGIVCRHCHFVQTEIRHVFPPMGNWSEERDPRADRELDRYVDDFNDMLKSNGLEEECCIVSHRSGPVWDLVPGVRGDMFPHQREAFEFMWNKLAGGTDIEQVRKNVKSDALSGCFISHAPGTGKTRLATTFVQSYLELFPRCSPVIIAPKVMLATWEDEFRKWNAKVPLHILNSTHICWDGDKTIQRLAANDDNLAQKLLDYEFRRDVMLLSWCEGNSVIALSYKLFTKFTKEEEEGDDDDDDTGRDREKMRQLRKMLLRRTDLLVLDEGHIPRNRDSQIWKCLAQVRTEKRIFLSGTLFQNNFVELRNILCLLQGDCHSKLPGKDEDKGFWASLTVDIIDERVNEVRAKMEPFLHIHTGDILHKSLPGLRESVVILNPFPMQKKIIAAMEKDDKHCSLELEYKISLASVHPSLITCMKNVSDELASIVDQPSLERIRLKPCEGVKARFVYEIVRRCYRLKERVLVFSQYLETLDLIREQLSREFHWTKDREILQMSGKVKVETRQSMMMAFNDMKSDAKVMLASTKACGEGIQLIGASRVVLLDVVWNPSVGKQAIGRAYRIGQQKIVHTYNLITEGTKEKSKFERQAKKDHMSKLLFSNESQPAQGNQSPQLISSDSILEDMTEDENMKEMFVNVLPSQWLSNLDLCVGGPQTPW